MNLRGEKAAMTLIRRMFVTVTVWTLAPWFAPLWAEETGTVTGTVVDQTGAAIANAEVVLKKSGLPVGKTAGDATGAFTISAAAGDYSLEASSPGFRMSIFEKIIVSEGETKILPPLTLRVAKPQPCEAYDFELPVLLFEPVASDRGEIGGEIVDNEGVFMTGVAVTISGRGGRSPTRTKTNRDGKFVVPNLASGIYSLTASRSGFADFVVSNVRVARGQRTRIKPPLPMNQCADGKNCRPVYKLRVPTICL